MSLPAIPDRTAPEPRLPATVGTSDARCRNCGEALLGEFCWRCGQRDLPPDPTLRELLHEAWGELVSIDGKVLSSVRLLLLQPGALTTEYLDGRRARHLPPLRLYLVCSVLYFLVSASIPSSVADRPSQSSISIANDSGVVRVGTGEDGAAPNSVVKNTGTARQRAERDSVISATLDSSRRATLVSLGRPVPAGPFDSATKRFVDSVRLERKLARELGPNPSWMKRVVVTRLIRNGARIGRERKSFSAQVKEQLPRVMFVLMPLFAALLALAYRSRRRRFPTHLIVSLHVHAFGFGALTLGALFAGLPVSLFRSAGLTAVTLWMLAYLPLALRRVYGGRLGIAVLRSVTLATLYAIAGLVVVSLLGVLLILLY